MESRYDYPTLILCDGWEAIVYWRLFVRDLATASSKNKHISADQGEMVMAGILADLEVAGKLGLRALGRRIRSEVEAAPDLDDFRSEMQQLLSAAPNELIRDHCWVDLSAKRPPWLPTGMCLEEGDEVTYFAEGRVYANKLLDIYVEPAMQLWCKVGEHGDIFRGTRASHSFVAPTGGEFMLGNYFPNDWTDMRGSRKQEDGVYNDVSGELRILLIRWSGHHATSLGRLRAGGDPRGRIETELQRIQGGDTTPPGWHYLWHLGPAEIYRKDTVGADNACIRCLTHGDVGILQKDIDLPLQEDTEISWRWVIDQLPSTIREDTVPSHDYLSLAVEFDNGRDITYYWSATLPEGAGYDCPLPNWNGKEYHVVVRSGLAGLGSWQDERRSLRADYRKYMGEPPARIVRVWLIANSIFQRSQGECTYADIVIHSGGLVNRVL